MVGQGEPSSNQTEEEFSRASEVEIAQATRLTREADKAAGKRHWGQQDDSGASKDEAEDGAASGGHHPKFNRQPQTGRDRLRDRSRMLHEEIGRTVWCHTRFLH
jgi:hypothetical protein